MLSLHWLWERRWGNVSSNELNKIYLIHCSRLSTRDCPDQDCSHGVYQVALFPVVATPNLALVIAVQSPNLCKIWWSDVKSVRSRVDVPFGVKPDVCRHRSCICAAAALRVFSAAARSIGKQLQRGQPERIQHFSRQPAQQQTLLPTAPQQLFPGSST